jgi:excisionase family DNA binding protein
MLTVSEVSAELRVSRGAIYALIRADVLPAVRVGRQLRVAEKVLANFVESGGRGWAGGWRKRTGNGGEAACRGRTEA